MPLDKGCLTLSVLFLPNDQSHLQIRHLEVFSCVFSKTKTRSYIQNQVASIQTSISYSILKVVFMVPGVKSGLFLFQEQALHSAVVSDFLQPVSFSCTLMTLMLWRFPDSFAEVGLVLCEIFPAMGPCSVMQTRHYIIQWLGISK